MGTEKPARFTAWRAFLCSIAAGAARANRGAGGTVGEDGDPGEIAKRLVAFGADGRGVEVAPAVKLDVAGDQLGLPEVSLQKGDCRCEDVSQADTGGLRQAGICQAGFWGNDG